MSELKPIDRIIKILERLSMGHHITASELYNQFDERVTLRTIQRDLIAIQEAGIPLMCSKNENKENVWSFSREYRNMIPPAIQKNELLSMYALKSYLKEFAGTNIESHLKSTIDKLENIVPGDVYTELEGKEDFVWDQDYGNFDYTEFGQILEEIIQVIIDKCWIKITYRSASTADAKTYSVFPYCLFSYHGALYLVVYAPDYNNTLSLLLHKIESTERIENPGETVPVFNLAQFKNDRFGVFGGDPQKVQLLINKDYISYFQNRQWHPTQKVKFQKDGNLLLEMDVPLSPELQTWILGWHEAIRVLAPIALIKEIKLKVNKIAEMYD